MKIKTFLDNYLIEFTEKKLTYLSSLTKLMYHSILIFIYLV